MYIIRKNQGRQKGMESENTCDQHMGEWSGRKRWWKCVRECAHLNDLHNCQSNARLSCVRSLKHMVVAERVVAGREVWIDHLSMRGSRSSITEEKDDGAGGNDFPKCPCAKEWDEDNKQG